MKPCFWHLQVQYAVRTSKQQNDQPDKRAKELHNKGVFEVKQDFFWKFSSGGLALHEAVLQLRVGQVFVDAG